ncbi:hypothetical protein ASE14_08095 [Agromyces sp. Root81]|uniref:hypothetical protein n=1 Tax=Agromyces sp. Root81 TaxID=1736601 RepID=UPI0006FA9F3F|nr:hypothetical protein [Agromyces sp. Root81]KRC60911.1 hypothetical protein ASE14_08095 [Agromyces sp. Root81]
MSAKHADPEYRKNARIIRGQVQQRRKRDDDVTCWRCGRAIHEEQTFDVGHINPDGGHSLDNLAPEHRYKSGRCQGNRAAGGRLGAARQQARTAGTKGLLPW